MNDSSPTPSRVLLTGASSQLGHALLRQLDGQHVHVHALSRQPAGAGLDWLDWLDWHRGDLREGWPAIEADVAISFGPLQALADALAALPKAPVRRLVATSSMSAESKRDSPVAEDRALSQSLRDAEAALRTQCERLGIGWTLLRPTMIWGLGIDRNLTPVAHRAMRTRLFPWPVGRGLRQPVHAADVAEAAWRALHDDAALGQALEIGGGERLPIDAMFKRVRGSLPVRTLPVPVPRPLLALVSALLPGLRGAISRVDQDLVADNTRLQALLGIEPRGFRPVAANWRAERQL